MSKDRFGLGVYYMLLSGIGLGCVSFFGKEGQAVFSIPALLFWRYFLAFLPSLVLFLYFEKKNTLKGRFFDQKLQLLRVFVVLLSQYSFFYYMQTSSLLSATLLLNTGPLFIPFIDRFFLRVYVGVSTWISVLVSFIGVLFVLPPGSELLSWHSAIGLFSGLCQGISQVLFGLHVGDRKKDVDFFAFYFFAAACCLIPYLMEGRTFNEGGYLGLKAVFIVIGLGAASIFNQYFRSLAFEQSRPGRLSAFLYISIVVAALFDWAVFHHIPTLLTTIGACLIILGGFLKVYLRKKILHKKERSRDLAP